MPLRVFSGDPKVTSAGDTRLLRRPPTEETTPIATGGDSVGPSSGCNWLANQGSRQSQKNVNAGMRAIYVSSVAAAKPPAAL